MLNPELQIIAVKHNNTTNNNNNEDRVKSEKSFIKKTILQTDEKNIRVSAWVQSTKCPLQRIPSQLTTVELSNQIPDSEDISLQAGMRNSSKIVVQLHEEQATNENDCIIPTHIHNEEKHVHNGNEVKHSLKEPSYGEFPISIGDGKESPHRMKREVIKTERLLINKLNNKLKSKKDR